MSSKFARKAIKHPGRLSKFGWAASKKAVSRHRALAACVRSQGYAPCVEMVNVLKVLNKRKNKKVSAKAAADVRWLERTHRNRG